MVKDTREKAQMKVGIKRSSNEAAGWVRKEMQSARVRSKEGL